MKLLTTSLAMALALIGATASPFVVVAQTAEKAQAEVRKIDKDAKKVTLKHGPIKSLDMPPMTMVFQVRDDSLFSKLQVGGKIRFTAENQQGAFVITSVESEENPKESK
jgi:Cu(I)/Ag(I) efflux system periplasmic protein CusF